MRRVSVIALLVSLLTAAAPAAPSAAVPAAAPADERVADVAAFLMDTSWEVALARSAAPAEVTSDATILVLGRDGYRLEVQGSNGFHCLVLRSFAGPRLSVDPRVRAPICFNPQASTSALRRAQILTEGMLSGGSLEEAQARLDAALAAGEIQRPGPGALAYMMSAGQWLNERVERWRPHLMFFAPDVTSADTGGFAALPGLPWVVGDSTGDWGDITVPLDEAMFVQVEEPMD